MLKAFVGEYHEVWAYGGYHKIICTVVANTESEALGLLLEKYPKLPDHWCVEEISLDKPAVIELSDRGT
jgi:hypothetical protein